MARDARPRSARHASSAGIASPLARLARAARARAARARPLALAAAALAVALAVLTWAVPGRPDDAEAPAATDAGARAPAVTGAPVPGTSVLGAPVTGTPVPGARTQGPPIDLSIEGTEGLVGDGACPACTHPCSFRHPLCVDAPRGTPGGVALAALDAADRAWDAITGALAAPSPDGGPDGRWHVQLADHVEGGSEVRPVTRDPVARFDRASSFARVDRALTPGCSLDRALARAVARASLWRAAPATDEGSAIAEAETLARLATPCAGGEGDSEAFQSAPERTIVAPGSLDRERGASVFFGWADATFASEPGRLIVGLWALAPTRTPPTASRWAAAPTGFDVLRASLKDALWPGSTFDDALVRFAVARASISPPSGGAPSGGPPSGGAPSGSAPSGGPPLMVPPVRLAWSIPWPSRARRLVAPRPVAPTGASYVLVDRAGAPPGAKLRLEAAWEDFGRMRWVAVKLDAAGQALAELPVTSLDRATRTSMTIESLDAAAAVLIVGVDVGSTEHPFDPDQGEWEPHGWLLTLEGE
ncbi:MAG TPA: hypothetical protein VH044_18920 [Polyangiaceae bacterium]|jgi:hypothetical protein|nr:hypothetical protein [Polyangiaceae bacterium]